MKIGGAAKMPVDAVLEGLQVEPFVPYNKFLCRSCGFRVSRLCGFYRWVLGMQPALSCSVHYCSGGKEPTTTVTSPFGGEQEVAVKCAGIMEPHLHVSCGFCHRHTLTRFAKEGVK